MLETIINQLTDFSDQELELITKNINEIKEERREAKIEELKKNFVKAWRELKEAGIELCYDEDDTILCFDDISFYNS